MNLLTKPILYAVMALALIAIIFSGVQTARLKTEKLGHAQTKLAHAQVLAKIAEHARLVAERVRAEERIHTQNVANIVSTNQQELQNAQDQYDADVAALNDGALQLQDRWRSCERRANVSGAVAGTGAPSGADRDRNESAARAVRAAEIADANNAALIAIVQEDRRICNGKVPEVKS